MVRRKGNCDAFQEKTKETTPDMRFSDQQAFRIECQRCFDNLFLPCIPDRWTEVVEIVDRLYTHRGICPRCSLEKNGQNPDAEPEFVPFVETGKPPCCGNCRWFGVLGEDSLPDYAKCMLPRVVRHADKYHIRHTATEGSKCGDFWST